MYCAAMARVAFLGGTGPEGLGLALRFALAGEEVVVGSRQLDRAEHAAQQLRTRLAAHRPGPLPVNAMLNAAAARGADVVALTVPFNALDTLLREVAPSLQGKIVLDVVNPLTVDSGLFKPRAVAAGSAGEHIQQLLPHVSVVSGFKHLSAKQLWEIEQPLRGDVLLCSDGTAATRYFSELTRRMPQLRAVDAGPLANARHLESMSALLLNLNKRYRATTSIAILGLNR